jgi:CubicO group peptidase (beta-lactamase class C family)
MVTNGSTNSKRAGDADLGIDGIDPLFTFSLELLDVMGMITAEATENPEPQPLVPWWSFSKTVLAAATLVLVDRHKLDLDVPVAGAPYTLRHLLQHTSGLPDYGPNPDYHRAVAARESPWTIDELLQRVNAWAKVCRP